MPNRYIVGVTGGIGSGKSLVRKVFEVLGYPGYDADSRAKILMQQHQPLKKAIVQQFGKESYDAQGHLNRAYLARRVFSSAGDNKTMNELVHPVVKEDFRQWTVMQPVGVVVKEAALLIESGQYKSVDYTIHVCAPIPLRIKRVLERDPHRSATQVKQIIDLQWSDDKKATYCSGVIANGISDKILPQILALEKVIAHSCRDK